MRFLRSPFIVFLMLACWMLSARSQVLTSRPHVGVEQVPYDDEVYSFLRHLSVRGLIEGYSEVELPLSEYEVAEFLRSADPAKMSEAERDLRVKYLQTYAHDSGQAVTMFSSQDATPLFFDGIFTDKDKYLYRWMDDSTNSDLLAHGILGLELRHESEPRTASVVLDNFGGRFSGTLGGHVGFFLQATNGEKFGDSLLALEDPLLGKNRNLQYYSHTFFDFTSAELSYNSDWFTGKIAREAIGIGGGYQNDNILISPNVPYFDFLSLGAHVKAVRYQAIFGSLLDDTLTGGPGSDIPPKFITVHDLTFLLGRDFEFGFTDMVVYSKRYDLAYLNPFSFLKSVEHALNDRDNGLLGAHTRWRMAPGIEVRGQALVDDIYASKIGTGWWQNKFAWQFGGMWAGAFGQPDLDFAAEWIRVEPYTYSHFDPDNRFSTSQTLLGAQIGPNAMSYWSSLKWRPSSRWLVSLEGQLVERGENLYDSTGMLLYNAGADYTLSTTKESNESQTYILNGRRVNILTLTANIEFEPWRGLVVFARGTKKSVNYLEQLPETPGVTVVGVSYAPRELPETLIAIGARALF